MARLMMNSLNEMTGMRVFTFCFCQQRRGFLLRYVLHPQLSSCLPVHYYNVGHLLWSPSSQGLKYPEVSRHNYLYIYIIVTLLRTLLPRSPDPLLIQDNAQSDCRDSTTPNTPSHYKMFVPVSVSCQLPGAQHSKGGCRSQNADERQGAERDHPRGCTLRFRCL